MSTTDQQAVFETLWENSLSLSRGWLSFAGSEEEIKIHGLTHGKLTVVGVARVEALGVVLTLHEAGSSYWAGRGDRGYAGATTYTVLILPIDGQDNFWRYVQLSRPVEVKGTDATRAAKTREAAATLDRFAKEVAQ